MHHIKSIKLDPADNTDIKLDCAFIMRIESRATKGFKLDKFKYHFQL